MTSSSPGARSDQKRPSGSPPNESRSEPGAHNALRLEWLAIRSKNLLYPAPENFKLFKPFKFFAPFTGPWRRGA
jgi:hypothetical protein